MNQRIAVRAIIRKDEKTLLLRRSDGRPTILGKYELPGGKLGYKEQPEDALRRYLYDGAGIHIQTAQLFDAVTYLDHDDRDIQYGVITYLVSMANSQDKIKLGSRYDKYQWVRVSDVQESEMTDLTQLLLGIIEQEALTHESTDTEDANVANNSTLKKVTIFSDGGSRGNPGPSACGYVILDEADNVIDEGGEYLGITTNNQAEYHGVRLGLEHAIKLGYKQVSFKIDSMLVVNQMNGIYKIKNRELWPINERIHELMKSFDKVSFSHVRREFNQLADGMVNKTLDAHATMYRDKV